MVAETTGSGTKVYYYGLGLISQGNALYYQYNAHGDVVQTYTGTGTASQSYTYDAFGVETDVTTGDTNPFRYAGQYFDTETGTYYLRARYYNPTLGRFTQQDAWSMANPADPLSLNLYVYCYGDPVRYYDPSGESVKDIFAGVIRAVDEALTGNVGQMVSQWITGNREYIYEDEFDYYIGRLVGDVVTLPISAAMMANGVTNIVKAIGAGITITAGSGGAATAVGVGVAVLEGAVGVAEITVGVKGASVALSNMGGDIKNVSEYFTGQKHHILSNKIMRAAKKNPVLYKTLKRGKSIVRAKTLEDHKGYQEWHRYVDNEMVKWLENNPSATSREFWTEIRKHYMADNVRNRFGADALDYINSQINLGGN